LIRREVSGGNDRVEVNAAAADEAIRRLLFGELARIEEFPAFEMDESDLMSDFQADRRLSLVD